MGLMMKKILRRRILIREYDYNKIKTKATAKVDRYETLYDRSTFTPLTKDDLEKEYLVYLLTKDENDVTINPMNSWKPTEYPASYLWHVKKSLYNEDYARWNCRFDDDGFLTVQYNKGTPESMIGWAVFEKEY
jgi:hypothetical protein